MTEKWRQVLDNGWETGAVLTDLSKIFDCINHNLLLVKINAYDLKKVRLILPRMFNYGCLHSVLLFFYFWY